MPKQKPVDDSHKACPSRRALGLPKGWRSVAAYRHYLNKQMERHAQGEIEHIDLVVATKAALTGTELLLIEARQRADDEGLAVMPDLEPEVESSAELGEVIEVEYETIDMKDRPDGTAVVVVLPTPKGKES